MAYCGALGQSLAGYNHDSLEQEEAMGRLCVKSFSVSIDGFGAGPNQSLEQPMGIGGHGLHQWAFPTATFQRMFGKEGGTTGVDNDFAVRGFNNIGAWILGRNMFGPVRGPWPDNNWKGWWGDDPPYHTPVFVLTHHARESITMQGGTTFHFITDGIRAALDHAMKAANGLDVRLGGGVSTVYEYLRADLIDELHIAISPVLLGTGEKLFADINLLSLNYEVVEHVPTQKATHVVLRKK